jgi:hypothetical protein
MTEKATAGWMCSKAQGLDGPTLTDVEELQRIPQSPSGRFRVGDLHYGLRGERVQGERGRMAGGLTVANSVAQDLINDIDRKFGHEPQQEHGLWTLDLELSRGDRALGGSRQHVIGIFVDRNDPDTIHVFDANRREVEIPRDQFAGWLSAHIKDVYGKISAISLYRAEEKRIGIFERKDDRWTCDEICVLSQGRLDDCRNEITKSMTASIDSGVLQDGPVPIYKNLWYDIDRLTVTTATLDDDVPWRITKKTVDRLFPLVARDGEPDMEALTALSSMLDQSVLIALNAKLTTSIQIEDEPFLPVNDEGRNIVSVSLMRTGDDVEITYTTEKFLTGLTAQNPDTGYYDLHGTSPWTDRIKSSATIKVSLDELHQAGLEGRVPNFEFLRPATARLQVESYTGIVNASINTDVPKIYRLQDAISAGEDLPGRWDQFDQAMRSRIGGSKWSDSRTTAHRSLNVCMSAQRRSR